jgi:D-arabinose 1-dehydrogenase
MILSFSHLTLQNATFLPFVGAFKKRARVEQLVAASPFSMGLLTPKPPHWHPAPPKLHEAVKISTRQLVDAGHSGGLPDIALGYAYRLAGEAGLPFVAGFSTPAEVHASMKAWRDIKAGKDAEDRKKKEEQVRQLFKEAGYLDWCWESPPPEEK